MPGPDSTASAVMPPCTRSRCGQIAKSRSVTGPRLVCGPSPGTGTQMSPARTSPPTPSPVPGPSTTRTEFGRAVFAEQLPQERSFIKAFANAGTFPSQVEALASDELAGATNEYFNNAPPGEILTDRANAIPVATFKGPKYFQFHDALQNAVTRVFDGLEDEQTSWNNWVTEVSAF